MSNNLPPIILSWQANGNTGWGLYGLHLALGLKACGREVYLAAGVDPTGVPAPLLAPLASMCTVPAAFDQDPILVSALGNNFAAPPQTGGKPARHVGLAVFEDSHIDAEAVERLSKYELLIAPSKWCADQLHKVGFPPIVRWRYEGVGALPFESSSDQPGVEVCHQGYDASLFHPAPRRRALRGSAGDDGRFLIFSGGKLEFRKGQDIVIEAFKRFRKTEEGKNAVLVTAWQNTWPQTMAGIWESGYVKGVPTTRLGVQDMAAWMVANDVPEDAFIDLGMLPQAEMANALRECDVALFPNRCEGATNMAVTEAMACGIPTILSANTGHLEYRALRHDAEYPPVYWLEEQPAVTLACPLFNAMEQWGESDPDEMVAHLLEIARNPERAAFQGDLCAGGMKAFSWSYRSPLFSEILR